MSASPRLRIGVMAAGLSCLALGLAQAQQVQNPDRTRDDQSRPSASGQTDRSSTLQSDRPTTLERRTANFRGPQTTAAGANAVVDRFLANCLLAKNKSEVELSEIAQQKSENAEVKQFAQKMVQDHRKMIEQLQPLAGMQAGTKRGAEGAYNTRTDSESVTRRGEASGVPGSSGAGQTVPTPGTTATSTTSDTTTDIAATGTSRDSSATAGGAIHQLMQIDRQITERCTQAARDELQQKTGAEFDKCFVGSAISAHMHALAALEVIGQQTQGQLAQIAQQAQPTVQQHLDHAKQLMKQLEGQTGARASQAERPSSRSRTE
jgi:predicted outer membrane protein